MRAIIKGYPAYGKSYIHPGELKSDYLRGKDFSASEQGGPYFSIRDIAADQSPFDGVMLSNTDETVNVIIQNDELLCLLIKAYDDIMTKLATVTAKIDAAMAINKAQEKKDA